MHGRLTTKTGQEWPDKHKMCGKSKKGLIFSFQGLQRASRGASGQGHRGSKRSGLPLGRGLRATERAHGAGAGCSAGRRLQLCFLNALWGKHVLQAVVALKDIVATARCFRARPCLSILARILVRTQLGTGDLPAAKAARWRDPPPPAFLLSTGKTLRPGICAALHLNCPRKLFVSQRT